jgi:hypothetical protein
MTTKKTLSGSDYFHLLLDRKMLRNGLVGNISRIHLELSADTDLERIGKKLLQNPTFQAVSQLKVKHRWPSLPKWGTRDCFVPRNDDKSRVIAKEERLKQSISKNIRIHSSISKSEFKSTVLNRKVDNENGLVFIDLCELEDGTKHVVISMHHVLCDHQGMNNFVQSLADQSVSFPLFPDAEKTNGLKVFRNFWFMTFYMLKRSSSKLGTLVEKNLRPARAPIFKVIEFTTQETEQIEKNAWSAGARIGRSAFYISATAQVVNQILQKRAINPPYIWFTVPTNQRKKGTAGHLVSNQLSFLFFRLDKEHLQTTASSVEVINQQLKVQIKDRITERYKDLLSALRFMPMPIYEGMVNLTSNGKMSSFGFSDLGTDAMKLRDFQDAMVVNTLHYPPVPSPPGFNVVVSKHNGRLKFVWAYFDEVMSGEEVTAMELSFRNILLKYA